MFSGVTRAPRARLTVNTLVVCALLLSAKRVAHAEAPNAPAAVPRDVAAAAADLAPTLPDGIVPGESTIVEVPGDRGAFVIHAPATNTRAIIYLHGMCGNVRAVETWKQALAHSGTLIGVMGDKPCGGGRLRWTKHYDRIQARVEAALRAVKQARGGLLDIAQPVLFGYSQGADRAEALTARFPKRYRLVILGGAPQLPRLAHLSDTSAVAFLAGELEVSGNMRLGAEVLAAAGKPARFFLLPKAKHGEFGPEGPRVMSELFSWLFRDAG